MDFVINIYLGAGGRLLEVVAQIQNKQNFVAAMMTHLVGKETTNIRYILKGQIY